jgi:hypothetical protein
MKYQDIILSAYENFNSRNIDEVFKTMNANVRWPNGWEGGYVSGFEEIRDYWNRQWKEIDPNVEPTGFKNLENDKVEVNVHQVAKDLSGKTIFDGHIKHIYTFENGLIKSMEIEA